MFSSVGIAGCLGGDDGSGNSGGLGGTDDCSIEQATGNVEPISVTVDGRLEEATHEVNLRWNARTQSELEARLGTHTANDGEKYLVFRFEITNSTDTTIQIGQTNFSVAAETPDTVDETGPTFLSGMDLEQLNRVQLKSGGTISNQIIFEVPAETTSATVQADEPRLEEEEEEDGAVAAFSPECDESIPFNLTGGEEPTEDSPEETTEESSDETTEESSDETPNTPTPSFTPEEFIEYLVNTVYNDSENRFQNRDNVYRGVKAFVHPDRRTEVEFDNGLPPIDAILDDDVSFELVDTDIIEERSNTEVVIGVVYLQGGDRYTRAYELRMGPDTDYEWYIWDING